MPKLPKSIYRKALQTAHRWLRREDVIAVGIGRRQRAGEPSAETCIVVTVRWKRPPQRLEQLGIAPLPKYIRAKTDANTYCRVPVDIRGAGGRVAGRLHGLVSCRLNTSSAVRGMVGAVVRRGNAKLIVTAAHVALKIGTPITINSPQGQVQGSVIDLFHTDTLDHALVEPDTILTNDAGRLPEGTPLSGVQEPTRLKLGDLVFFRTQDGRLQAVAIDSIEETATFDTPWGRVKFRGLISAAPIRSSPGDSGTLLYDDSFRALGTLVGELSSRDYFLPCKSSFSALNLTLCN